MMQAIMRNEVTGGEAKKRKLADGRSVPALLVSADGSVTRRTKTTELELNSTNFVIPKRAKFDKGNSEKVKSDESTVRGNSDSRGAKQATSSRPVRPVIAGSSKPVGVHNGVARRAVAPPYVSALARPDPGRLLKAPLGQSRVAEPAPCVVPSVRPLSSVKSRVLPRPPVMVSRAAAVGGQAIKGAIVRPGMNKVKVVVPAEQENCRPKLARSNVPPKPKVTTVPLPKSHQVVRPVRPTGLNRLVAQPPLRMPMIRPPSSSPVTPPKRPMRPLYPKSLPLSRPPMGARPHPVRRPPLTSYDPFGLDVMTEDDLDFIDDDETESEDWKRELRSITKYDPSAFSGQDDEALESSQFKLDREEQISEMIAKKEDKDELRKILNEEGASSTRHCDDK